MPNIDGKDVSPDEAMLLGRCPECAQPLIPKTARAHASDHWFGMDPNDPWLSEEARRRYKLIIDFAAARYNPQSPQEQKQASEPEKTRMSGAPSDRPVKTFLDYVALSLILEAGAAFWRGEGVSRVTIGLIAGAAVLAAHYKWDWLAKTLGERFTKTARGVAADFRWWLLPVGLLFLYVGFPTLLSKTNKMIVPQRMQPQRGEVIGHVTDYSGNVVVGPAKNDSPLADDALKWKLQEALGRDLRVPSVNTDKPNPNQCQVVIVHDADTYARHLADDLAAVITSSGGNVYVQPHAIDLPDEGIRVFAPRGRQFDCATRFTTRLSMVLGRLILTMPTSYQTTPKN